MRSCQTSRMQKGGIAIGTGLTSRPLANRAARPAGTQAMRSDAATIGGTFREQILNASGGIQRSGILKEAGRRVEYAGPQLLLGRREQPVEMDRCNIHLMNEPALIMHGT